MFFIISFLNFNKQNQMYSPLIQLTTFATYAQVAISSNKGPLFDSIFALVTKTTSQYDYHMAFYQQLNYSSKFAPVQGYIFGKDPLYLQMFLDQNPDAFFISFKNPKT